MTVSNEAWRRIQAAITRGEAAADGLSAQVAKLRGLHAKARADGIDDIATALIAIASAVEQRTDKIRTVLVELGARSDPRLEDTQPIVAPPPRGKP